MVGAEGVDENGSPVVTALAWPCRAVRIHVCWALKKDESLTWKVNMAKSERAGKCDRGRGQVQTHKRRS
eukprot:2785533-Pleurochrysis_carterae.AAC.2